MLRMSRLTDYSTVIMSYLARQPQDVHSVTSVAAALGVAVPTTSKILKMLVRRGLVQSTRGARGGYCLARAPERISVAEVIEAMEGDFGMTECSIEAGLCVREASCPLRENWRRINQLIRGVLNQVTLTDMIRPDFRPHLNGAAPTPAHGS